MSTTRISNPAEQAVDTRAWNVHGPHPTHVPSQPRDGHPPEPTWLTDREIRNFDERAVTVE